MSSNSTESAECSVIFIDDMATAFVEDIQTAAAEKFPGHEDVFVATIMQKLTHAKRPNKP